MQSAVRHINPSVEINVIESERHVKSVSPSNAVSLEPETSEMELLTMEEPELNGVKELPNYKEAIIEVNNVQPTHDDHLLTDDDSVSACVTPPKTEIRPLLKRPSRAIHSSLSAAKVIECPKRIKGSEHRTPSFSSSRVTRSKTRIHSSPAGTLSAAKSSGASKIETPQVIRKHNVISKSSEHIRTNSVDSYRCGSQTSSAAKSRQVSRLITTPNTKSTTLKPKGTDSAQKRLQIEEERRLQVLREKLEREQRAKEKKMDYLNKRVMENKSKREEREKKVAIMKRKNEEMKLEMEKKKMEKEDHRKKEVEEWKQKDLQNKKGKTKPWCSSDSVRKEDRIHLLNKKKEELDQKTKHAATTVSSAASSAHITTAATSSTTANETVTVEDNALKTTMVVSNKENVIKGNAAMNATYKAIEHP